MDAIDKTAELRRKTVKISQLVKREDNPNKMNKRQFDLLVDNIQRVGMTDAIMVRPLPKEKPKDPQLYRITGGHHRYDAAIFLDFQEVPVTILPDGFDEDEETFQVLRMNAIRGKLDPMKFCAIYERYREKYTKDQLQELFGFDDDKAFARIVNATAKSIEDPAMKAEFKKAAKEVKTIDGLAAILNRIFSEHGDTLPYGYLIFDHAGRKSVWLRIEAKTLKAVNKIGARCLEERRTMDAVLGGLVQLIAEGKLDEHLSAILAKAPEVDMPEGLSTAPTLDNIAHHGKSLGAQL